MRGRAARPAGPGGAVRAGGADRPVLAVVESALVTVAALGLIVVITVAVATSSPGTVTGDDFGWASGAAVAVILIAAGALAGLVALRRLPAGDRRALALAGPMLVITLAAVPALLDGQWVSVLLYELTTLAGLAAAVLVHGRRSG